MCSIVRCHSKLINWHYIGVWFSWVYDRKAFQYPSKHKIDSGVLSWELLLTVVTQMKHHPPEAPASLPHLALGATPSALWLAGLGTHVIHHPLRVSPAFYFSFSSSVFISWTKMSSNPKSSGKMSSPYLLYKLWNYFSESETWWTYKTVLSPCRIHENKLQ